MIEAAPVYVSHKEVRALKIKEVIAQGTDTTMDENEIVKIVFEDESFEPIVTSLRKKPTPAAGWYFVDYGNYFSFSPADKFEEGYTLKL